MDNNEMTAGERETKEVVDALYRAFLSKDPDGMVDVMSKNVSVRFLGQIEFQGHDKAREFFNSEGPELEDFRFDIKKLIVDGSHASAIWEESARTRDGKRYENHGVDVLEVRGGEIVSVHENNDISTYRSYFGRG